MRFENIKNLKPEEFRRLTGVKSETFKKMVEIIDIYRARLGCVNFNHAASPIEENV